MAIAHSFVTCTVLEASGSRLARFLQVRREPEKVVEMGFIRMLRRRIMRGDVGKINIERKATGGMDVNFDNAD